MPNAVRWWMTFVIWLDGTVWTLLGWHSHGASEGSLWWLRRPCCLALMWIWTWPNCHPLSEKMILWVSAEHLLGNKLNHPTKTHDICPHPPLSSFFYSMICLLGCFPLKKGEAGQQKCWTGSKDRECNQDRWCCLCFTWEVRALLALEKVCHFSCILPRNGVARTDKLKVI